MSRKRKELKPATINLIADTLDNYFDIEVIKNKIIPTKIDCLILNRKQSKICTFNFNVGTSFGCKSFATLHREFDPQSMSIIERLCKIYSIGIVTDGDHATVLPNRVLNAPKDLGDTTSFLELREKKSPIRGADRVNIAFWIEKEVKKGRKTNNLVAELGISKSTFNRIRKETSSGVYKRISDSVHHVMTAAPPKHHPILDDDAVFARLSTARADFKSKLDVFRDSKQKLRRSYQTLVEELSSFSDIAKREFINAIDN